MSELFDGELDELRDLWFEKCWSCSEIAEWFGIPLAHVYEYIHSFKVSSEEYREKKADFAEFLKVYGRRKPLKRLVEKRLKRLEAAYARS